MFVRIRVNTWNLKKVVIPAIKFYTTSNVPVVLTFMAYYTQSVPFWHRKNYVWKKRTINSYFCLKQNVVDRIINRFKTNPLVYTCGFKNTHACKFCGNCIREYYNAKERLRKD